MDTAASDLQGPVGLRGRIALAVRGGGSTHPLMQSAYSLGLNSVLTAGLGMAFWILAARLYSSSDIGCDAALIAAMVPLSTIAQLNLGNSLVRFMPRSSVAGRLLASAYGASVVAACLLATGFVLIAPRVSDSFDFLTDEPLIAALYVGAVALWGVFALQDAALTATRHARWVPIENGVFGLLKFIALPLLLAVGAAHGPLLAWALPMCLLVVPVNWLIFGHILKKHTSEAQPAQREAPFTGRRLRRFLALDYLSTVFIQASLTVLPLIVVATLGTEANAYFYVAFTIALAVDSLSYNVATSLVAEGARDPDKVSSLVRLLVRRMSLFVVPIVLVLIIAAPLVIIPFGQEYVQQSSNVLRILMCATLFRAAVALAAAILRLEGKAGRIAALDGSLMAVCFIAAVPLAHAWGLEGVAVAWLAAAVAMGVAVLPLVVRHYRVAAADS